jgi:tetratricopeptide (TPR) repeat protein
VVISDFEGGSVPPRADIQFWGKALASLLITDLQSSENLRVVDRQHLANILREHSISASALADPATRLRVGRIIGANFFIFGTYTIIGDSTMLTARLDDVETGQIVKSEQVAGKVDEMRPLSRKLSIAFLRGLDARLAGQEAERIAEVGGPPPEAVRHFAEGLDYEHQRRYDKAIEHYSKALAIYPKYQEAREHLEKASEMAVR